MEWMSPRDWTTDPLIAAFFSAHKANKNKEICVLAFNTSYICDSNTQGLIRFHKNLKYHGLEFLYLQKGLFTEMIGAEGYYFHNGNWPSLNNYLKATYRSPGVEASPTIRIFGQNRN